jgi:hypothetical protein
MSNAPSALERLTINLVGRASKALALATEITGDSKTDTVNRAVQVYSYLLHKVDEGSTVVIRDAQGNESRIVFL